MKKPNKYERFFDRLIAMNDEDARDFIRRVDVRLSKRKRSPIAAVNYAVRMLEKESS